MSNMVVRTNVMALNSHRSLGLTGNQQRNATARLSSGFRINSAADDAAGLAISEKMRAQIRGLNQASRNSQDAISLIQTAEGGLSTVNEMLIRMRELVVQAANDTNYFQGGVGNGEDDNGEDDNGEVRGGLNMGEGHHNSDRGRIQEELVELAREIQATANRIEFNMRTLLAGATAAVAAGTLGPAGMQVPANGQRGAATSRQAPTLHFQIGANSHQSLLLDARRFDVVNIINMANIGGTSDETTGASNSDGLWINRADPVTGETDDLDDAAMGTFNVDIASGSDIAMFIDSLDNALGGITAARSYLGANQNRLEFTIENLNIASENLSASESRVRDADMALEMMRLTQANVLQQAATAMLAQANQAPQSILQLLG